MSTHELEALAAKFGIGGYADQRGNVDRTIIIEQLVKRDEAVGEDDGPSATPGGMQPFRAYKILQDLLSDAADLRSEPFSSPEREEWTDTAEAALRRIFGPDDPIIKNFGRSQSILFKQGDTQENLRRAANDTLASEEAVLRSAITQLGWNWPPTTPDAADGPKEEVKIVEDRHTYLLRDGFVFEDDEKWEGASVDIRGNGSALVGEFTGESIAQISRLRFSTMKKLFHSIEIWIPSAVENPFDWDFGFMDAEPSSENENEVEVTFRLEYDVEGNNILDTLILSRYSCLS